MRKMLFTSLLLAACQLPGQVSEASSDPTEAFDWSGDDSTTGDPEGSEGSTDDTSDGYQPPIFDVGFPGTSDPEPLPVACDHSPQGEYACIWVPTWERYRCSDTCVVPSPDYMACGRVECDCDPVSGYWRCQ